jgi:predicted O-methyltransferase YrrM
MHAGTVESADWWARSRTDNASWVGTYQNSLGSRHRTVIANIVKGIGPASVLELGAHCGPNLVRLAQECPEIEQLSGVEANKDAVAEGQKWFTRLGLSERIELACGRLTDATLSLPSQCVDVVLSCYALAYIAPDDLPAVLYEMGRLAKRAVVIAEPMTDADKAAWHGTVTGYQEWAHNYQDASRWVQTWRGMALRRETVSPPVDRLESVLVAVRG